MSCNPGMPKRAVVCRSTSRISAAVSAFMIDLLLVTKLQHPPAADIHHLSSDVFSFLGSEERHRRGHIFHRGRAAEGKPRVPHAACLAQCQLILVNAGRVHHINRNPVFGFFQRKGTRQRHHRRLGRRIRGNFRLPESSLRSYRAQINNSSPAPLAHVRQHRPAYIKTRKQIGRKNPMPVFQRTFRHRAPAKIPHVINDDVQPPKTLPHCLHQLSRTRRIGNIRLHRHAFHAHRLDLSQGLLRRRLIRTISDSHSRPILPQPRRDSPPDPAASSGYQRHSIAKRHSSPSPTNFRKLASIAHVPEFSAPNVPFPRPLHPYRWDGRRSQSSYAPRLKNLANYTDRGTMTTT